MKEYILILSVFLGLNATAALPYKYAPQPIIRRLAKLTNNFTNPDGTPMQPHTMTFENIVLKKLKEPDFREQFVDETLLMHEQLTTDLAKDMKEAIEANRSYGHFSKYATFGSVEYSSRMPFGKMFDDFNLLKLMFASMAYMHPEELANFRAKIIKHLALSKSHVTQLNSLKDVIINRDTRREMISRYEHSNYPSDILERIKINRVKENMYREQIVATLLQAELAELPIIETGSFVTLNQNDKNYWDNFKNSKKVTIERIRLLITAISLKLIPPNAQGYLLRNLASLPHVEILKDGPVKDIMASEQVILTLNDLLEVLVKPRNFKVNFGPLPPMCASLFN